MSEPKNANPEDATAAAVLAANLGALKDKDAEFAGSLLSQLKKKGSLSAKQWPWVHKLAIRATAPPAPTVTLDLAPLLAMFDMASEHVKYPKITLVTKDGKVQISRAGAKAKVPGSLNVTDGRKYGENTWYGRILVDGTWEMPNETPPSWVIELVKEMAANPTGVAKGQGHATGNCCFCMKEIKTAASMEVGYGPDCAKKFGLDWGGKKAAPKAKPSPHKLQTLGKKVAAKAKAMAEKPVEMSGMTFKEAQPEPEPEITAEDAGFDCGSCMDEGYILAGDGGLLPCMKCNAYPEMEGKEMMS